MKRLSVWPIAEHEVRAAVEILIAGSTSPDAEDLDDLESYIEAIVETRNRDGEVFVADLDGEIVGVCQVIIFPHFQHTGGWCCELETFYVREDLRSQGIGAQLLVAAESFARERGCYRVQLTSRNYRVDAHRFYQTHGYDQGSQGFKKLLEG